MRPLAVAAVLASFVGAHLDVGEARADEPEVPSADGEPSPEMRLLALGAALVPGAVVRGAGHWVLGREAAAGKLLAAQGIGFGLILLGGVPIVATGASRHVTGPAATTAIVGVGLFGLSWLADVVGVALPMSWRGAPQLSESLVTAEIGYRLVEQPAFDFRHFAFQRLDLRLGPMRFSPELSTALEAPNARLRVEAAYRMLGPRPDRAAPNGSWLEVRVAGGRHLFAPERFSAVGAEATAATRVDLESLDRWLAGAFFELEIGAGWQRFVYDEAPPDDETVLLARFAYGLYLGDPTRGTPYGELTHWYDQRHDDFAGGLTGRALGIPGHMGLSLRLWLHEQAGLEAMGEVGAAYVAGLSVLMRSSPGELP